MKFRTIPPDPAEFPRVRLLWPPALPALILLFAWLADLAGHQWNIHGDGALVLAAFFLLLLVGTVASIFSLAVLLPALRNHPTLRTRSNLACTGISLVFVVLAAVYLIIGVAKALLS